MLKKLVVLAFVSGALLATTLGCCEMSAAPAACYLAQEERQEQLDEWARQVQATQQQQPQQQQQRPMTIKCSTEPGFGHLGTDTTCTEQPQ